MCMHCPKISFFFLFEGGVDAPENERKRKRERERERDRDRDRKR